MSDGRTRNRFSKQSNILTIHIDRYISVTEPVIVLYRCIIASFTRMSRRGRQTFCLGTGYFAVDETIWDLSIIAHRIVLAETRWKCPAALWLAPIHEQKDECTGWSQIEASQERFLRPTRVCQKVTWGIQTPLDQGIGNWYGLGPANVSYVRRKRKRGWA